MSSLSNYAGWIFRLNLPTSSSAASPPAATEKTAITPTWKGCSCYHRTSRKKAMVLMTTSVSFLSCRALSSRVSVTTLDQSEATQPPSPSQNWSWSFSSQSCPSKWNVTSSKLLSVTYRPAHEAHPSYTNISRSREYWNNQLDRCGKCSTCLGGGSGGSSQSPKRRGKWSSMKRTMSGAPKPIHRVKVDYTVEDICILNQFRLRILEMRRRMGCGFEPWTNGTICNPHMEFKGCDAKKLGEVQKEVKHWGPILTFAIPCQDDESKEPTAKDKCQPLLWKVHHPPNPNVALDSFLLMEGALNLHMQNLQGKSSSSFDYDVPTNVYVNGYQSWSFAGSVVQGEPQPGSAMPDVLSGAFNRGGVVLSGDHASCDGDSWSDNFETATNTRNTNSMDDVEELNATTAFYKSDMFACISSNGTTSRTMMDVFYLTRKKTVWRCLHGQGTSPFQPFRMSRGQVATRNDISSDWAYLQIVDSSCYDEEAMVYYIHACGDHNDARAMEKGLTYGWCSWYHYYENIDHDSLSKNAHVLNKAKSKIGFNLCLVDDGYMTSWGDWTSLKPGKFVKEGGMRVLADAIRSKGMQPEFKAAKDHPDWIIRNDSGRYANSANCGKFFYGLDATNPEVRKHVYDTIHRAVHEWGFDVLKLDFLYASCLAGNGKYDNTMSRAEAFYLGLRTIREAAGDETFIIGCGCPLGTAIGWADGMRVSCDTGPTWLPEFPLPHWDNGTLPSLRGMLRNTLSRSVLGHRWWHNDPDCVLLGNTTKHTDNEVISAASVVGMTGGMFLLSDDMEKVSDARLSVARKIFPLTGVTAVPLDLHSTMNGGMPSVLRLWCTEKSITTDEVNDNFEVDVSGRVLREQASKLQTEVGWSPRNNNIDPYSRERSCFFVAPGLGSWTVASLSNWMSHSTTMSVSFAALVAHSIQDFAAMGAPKDSISSNAGPGEKSENGYHVFSFWSSEYVWIPHETLVDNSPLVKKLDDPTSCQYIGSDLHFSCGFEVSSFVAGEKRVLIELKNNYAKKGSVYLYLPVGKKFDNATVEVNGAEGSMEIIARPTLGGNEGVVVRVPVVIKGTGEEMMVLSRYPVDVSVVKIVI
ncbi:alpha-galactosidase [Skeletonema marinoi]|uniref:Alpha-galactosidase n=1 Tax=Skeletonema marinoi TaxID=267567 RepID=A0AAD9DDX7_9STRA|nr:alpha-galactosidase [Skeletonema marinoi]